LIASINKIKKGENEMIDYRTITVFIINNTVNSDGQREEIMITRGNHRTLNARRKYAQRLCDEKNMKDPKAHWYVLEWRE